MAMQVILTQDVEHLGKAGELVVQDHPGESLQPHRIEVDAGVQHQPAGTRAVGELFVRARRGRTHRVGAGGASRFVLEEHLHVRDLRSFRAKPRHEGLERAQRNGHDLTQIVSVASFFVSRVDTEIDARLEKLQRSDLAGLAALANARLAYERAYLKELLSRLKPGVPGRRPPTDPTDPDSRNPIWGWLAMVLLLALLAAAIWWLLANKKSPRP